MMFMIAKPKNSPFSLFQTINGVCVMNTSAVYPSSNEEGNAGDWEKLWTLLKVWTPQKSSTPEEPGSLNRKTSTSRPSLEPQNPDSGILKVGFSLEPLKKGWFLPTMDPGFAQTCPNFWLCQLGICIQSSYDDLSLSYDCCMIITGSSYDHNV